jgi:putative copper export protein
LHPGLELAQLATAATAVRLSLHVLAATVFVGGQLTVAGLLTTVRSLGEGAAKAVAHRFAQLAWPAYVVLVATGFWNIAATKPSTQPASWRVVLIVKVVVVALAGTSAFAHQRARTKAGLAAFGALAGLTSLTAVVLGVLLAG